MLTRKTFTYILALVPYICLALPADSDTSLREIKNSLEAQSMPSHIGYTKVLEGLSDSMVTPSTVAPYWTGSALYNGTMTRIQLVQVIYDTLLAFPHLPFSSSNPSQAEIQQAFASTALAINMPTEQTLQDTAYTIIQSIKSSSEIAEALFYLHTLQQKTTSCLNYWPENTLSEKPEIIVERVNYNNNIPSSPSDCQTIKCSTDTQLPYNGFSDISRQAHHTRQLLTSINCTDQSITIGAHNGGKTNLCTLLKYYINKDTSITAAPATVSGSSLPLATGKQYLDNIIENSSKIEEILKTILILQIDEKITDPSLKLESISSIYQPPKGSSPATCSSSSTTATPGANSTSCTPSEPYLPDGSTTLYVSQLLGLGELESVIKPGIPQGLPSNVILVSGKYLTFNPIAGSINVLRAIDSIQRARPAREQIALYMSSASFDKVTHNRNLTELKFYEARTQSQDTAIDFLMSKSASLDIINDIRTQNERVIAYQNSLSQYRSKQLTLLKDTAMWRIDASNSSWLDSIATASNDSLLREIAILLAEIKHIQYHKYANTQKMLLMTAILTSKTKSLKNVQVLFDSFDRNIYTILSGGIGSDPISPPNTAALNNRSNAAVASLMSSLPPAPASASSSPATASTASAIQSTLPRIP